MAIDSVSGAVAFQQTNLANNVSTAVAGKVLSAQRQEGANVLQLLQSASQSAPGNVSAGNSLGGKFTITA